MKKIILVFMLLTIASTFSISSLTVAADEMSGGVPYKTYTMGVNRRLVETDTAYVPVGILNQNYLLNAPRDIHYQNDYVFVANTGGKNVVVFTTRGEYVKTIGAGILNEPMGIYVTDEMDIYVADKGLKQLLVFDFDGNHMNTFYKPTEPLFGEDSPYTPEKVVVDSGGNVYITGEGSVNGIIQMNRNGVFRGYFGVNQTRFDWRMRFSDWFLAITDELAKNLPPAPTNLAISDKGLVYTITSNIDDGIKKFNMMSVVIMTAGYTPEDLLVDIDIDGYENIFVLDDQGQIHQYDQYGRLLFRFGGLDTGNQLLGLFSQPTGITVDELGNLYVVDKGYSNVQIFYPTAFVSQINEGNDYYFQGKLEESKEIWEQLHKQNSNFSIANSALGDIYMKSGDYDLALEHYELAKDRNGYSESFWEIRNLWLQNNAGTILVVIISLIGLNIVLALTGLKRKLAHSLEIPVKTLTSAHFYAPVKVLGRMIKNPADAIYRIKRENAVSTRSATFLYFLLFFLVILSYATTSFLFSHVEVANVNLIMELVKVVGVLILWGVANYLISTLSEGEGWFKDIYRGTIYALAPIIFGIIPLAILSNLLSYNEAFLYSFTRFIIYAWSGILIFITVKEIHNYSFLETIKNIVLTIFTMIIIALLMFIIYLLFNQLMEFLFSLVKEVVIRVQH
ncbi:MAG: YIP1 family protein [Bacilli bacterium]|nr:YIP1 family protein [Bacilli bacterium]